MGWRRGTWENKAHECSLPGSGGIGSIWRCRCGQRWLLRTREGARVTWRRIGGDA